MIKKITVLLLIVTFLQPLGVAAYGGGIPPVIGPGPNIDQRLELIEKRLSERMKLIRERLASIEERLNSRLNTVRERISSIFDRSISYRQSR